MLAQCSRDRRGVQSAGRLRRWRQRHGQFEWIEWIDGGYGDFGERKRRYLW